jgi:transcription-repair coupling factor (superfamily II helicase)
MEGARSPRAALARLTPFEPPPDALGVIDCGGRTGATSRPSGRTRTPTCSTPRSRMCGAARARPRVIVAGWSDGSRERLSHVLAEHGLKSLELVSSYAQAKTAAPARCRWP